MRCITAGFLHILVILLISAMPLKVRAENVQREEELVTRAERYLNSKKSFSARFMQGMDNGQVMTGTLLISRPGKMNLTYDPPSKDFIIADGSFVYLWDGELSQHTTLPLGGSLAGLILQNDIRLSGDVEVLSTKQSAGQLEITLQYRKDPEQGTLTLLFEVQPLQFRGWRVRDAQNQETTVTLQNVQENVALAAQSFVFTPPQLGKNTKTDRAINE